MVAPAEAAHLTRKYRTDSGSDTCDAHGVTSGDTRITTPRSSESVGVIVGFGAYLCWGLFPLFFHALGANSPIEILCHRMIWALVAVAIPLAVTHDWGWIALLRRNRSELARTTAAALLIGSNWGIYIWAATHGHVIEAALGYFINPLVVVSMGVLILGERLRTSQWAAVGFGGASVVAVTIAAGRVPWVALFLAFTFAGYGYLKRGTRLTAIQSLAAETAVFAPFAVAGIAYLHVVGTARFAGDAGLSGSLMLVAAGPITAIPLVMYAAAARRLPFSLLGLMQYISPMMQFLCGVIVFGETMSSARWFGFAMVWVSVVLIGADLISRLRTAETRPTPHGSGMMSG